MRSATWQQDRGLGIWLVCCKFGYSSLRKCFTGKVYFFTCLMGKNYGLPLKISIVLLKNTLVRFIITCNWGQCFSLFFFFSFLCHKVRHKPSKHDECMDEIHKLLTQTFPGQSGSLSPLFHDLTFNLKCLWNDKYFLLAGVFERFFHKI